MNIKEYRNDASIKMSYTNKLDKLLFNLNEAIIFIDTFMSINHIDYMHFQNLKNKLIDDIIFYKLVREIDETINPSVFEYDSENSCFVLQHFDASDERGWRDIKLMYDLNTDSTFRLEVDQDGGEEIFEIGEGLVL